MEGKSGAGWRTALKHLSGRERAVGYARSRRTANPSTLNAGWRWKLRCWLAAKPALRELCAAREACRRTGSSRRGSGSFSRTRHSRAPSTSTAGAVRTSGVGERGHFGAAGVQPGRSRQPGRAPALSEQHREDGGGPGGCFAEHPSSAPTRGQTPSSQGQEDKTRIRPVTLGSTQPLEGCVPSFPEPRLEIPTRTEVPVAIRRREDASAER